MCQEAHLIFLGIIDATVHRAAAVIANNMGISNQSDEIAEG